MGNDAKRKQVNFRLPPDLHRMLLIRAAEVGSSASDLLERGVRLVIRETEGRGQRHRARAEDAVGVGAVHVEPRKGGV